MSFFPLVLNMDYFPVLIVGGGNVAFRKARVLYPYARELRVLSRAIESEFVDFLKSRSIPFLVADYSSNHLSGIRLCIAATGSKALNSRICKDCLSLGILSNNVSSIEEGQVSFSSFFANDSLLASFFTYGKAPVLARKIREDFKDRYSPFYLEYIDFLSSHRDEYNNRLSAEFRHEFWDKVFSILMEGCSLKELREKINILLCDYSR